MSAEEKRIDGKLIAEDVVATVKAETAKLVAENRVTPGLAVIIVGEDPASQVYVASKGKKAKRLRFPLNTTHFAG